MHPPEGELCIGELATYADTFELSLLGYEGHRRLKKKKENLLGQAKDP